MNGGGVLRRVAGALSSANVPFMLTGSVAAAYHGAPRATLDIDLVIDAAPTQLHAIVAACLDAGLYASEEAALESHRSGGMFNAIDAASGWKVDLIHRRDRAFSREEFARRIPAILDDVPVAVASLEDVILSKLEWARLGGSARQLEDVATLIRVRGDDLDRAYVERWVAALVLGDEWEKVERALG
ncbi:MAG: nucleotidyl transferase AbiEii/AbiGii toxin family protein [Gemmatimonadaceae bacterium]